MKKLLTSESVNCGHPDKTCDIIADSFLDEALSQDESAQMAVECAIKDNKLFIYGEATTKASLDYVQIAKKTLEEIGYDADSFEFVVQVSKQSQEINNAVVKSELCANDQGIVFGYACDETKQLMPLPLMLAHDLMRTYEEYRKINHDFLADAKSQVSVEYDDDRPVKIKTILVSVSHKDNLSNQEIYELIKANVIGKVLESCEVDYSDVEIIINPSGRFTIWGSYGDSGCVGRKIVVDTYGGFAPVGGGCFSSKNATKVDRSGAYYARYVAKNIVAHNLAKRCLIHVSYGIGIKYPLSIDIDTFGTEKVTKEEIYEFVNKNFDFSVGNMIEELDLLKPIFKDTACYGHFGNENFSWEKIKLNCK